MMVSLLSSGKFSQKTAEINKPRNKRYCCVTASFPKPDFSQKQKRTSPFTLLAEAARTSASQSFSKFWNAGTKSFLVISGPTAFCNFIQTRKQPELKHPHRDNGPRPNMPNMFPKNPLLRTCRPPYSALSRTCPRLPDAELA